MAPSRTRGITLLAWLTAMLALVAQIALGATVLPDAEAPDGPAALAAASLLCLGNPAPTDDGTSHRHHGIDQALCPIAVAMAQPAAILTPVMDLPPPPTSIPIARRPTPPGRGPPHPSIRVAAPRAPPSLA